MSANSTLSSNNSASLFALYCLVFQPNSWVFIVFTLTNALLLPPLCVLVLYHGLQRWWQRRSSPSTAAANHSDNFTYHLVIMEMLNVLGTGVCCYGIYTGDVKMINVFFCLFSVTWYGETIFHVLTCVEHYLAVVHPITYLRLKENRWTRIRNISIACIWVVCLGLTGLVALEINTFTVDFSLLILSVVIISFCNLSALCSLVRPGPAERERVDPSKQRAFYVIEAILGVLLLRCVWNLVWSVQTLLQVKINKCVWFVADVWINLPSSLVLPLLFLQRSGTLACCKCV